MKALLIIFLFMNIANSAELNGKYSTDNTDDAGFNFSSEVSAGILINF